MFHDASILCMLYDMGKVCYNQIVMYGFETKGEKERFTVVSPRCRQNLKIGHFTLLGNLRFTTATVDENVT